MSQITYNLSGFGPEGQRDHGGGLVTGSHADMEGGEAAAAGSSLEKDRE